MIRPLSNIKGSLCALIHRLQSLISRYRNTFPIATSDIQHYRNTFPIANLQTFDNHIMYQHRMLLLFSASTRSETF